MKATATRSGSLRQAVRIRDHQFTIDEPTDKGGDDMIIAGNGEKAIIGGFGSDSITAVDGTMLAIGDNGAFTYDGVAKNGVLRTDNWIELLFTKGFYAAVPVTGSISFTNLSSFVPTTSGSGT